MKGAGHNSVGEVESFLNSVSVMDVDIDVEYSLVHSAKGDKN